MNSASVAGQGGDNTECVHRQQRAGEEGGFEEGPDILQMLRNYWLNKYIKEKSRFKKLSTG